MNNINNHSEEEIRPPDAIVSERLLPQNINDRDDDINRSEKEMSDALYISMQEYNIQNEIQSDYEERIIQEFTAERNRRVELFKDFLFQMNRIGRYDKEVREMYSILEPIIDSYCNQYIQTCELDIETHTKIFDIVKKIRNHLVILPLLEKIIIPTPEK
jgi:hypothetical protein